MIGMENQQLHSRRLTLRLVRQEDGPALREMLREENPGCLLQVDGGVDERTSAVCKENGAQVLVTGSAYFRAPDRAAFVRRIQSEEQE